MTHTRRNVAFILIVLLAIYVTPAPIQAGQATEKGDSFFLGPELNLDVTSFVLLETGSGQILAEHNASEPIGPASLAKLMTLDLAFGAIEAGTLSLDDEVPISEKAWSTGGSKMFVLVGTKVSVRNLLYGTAVSSGNDAAVALAEYMAGSEDVFVQHMNDRARELGMKNTTFKTAHGLTTEGQVTTAMDMAILAKAFVEDHPEAMEFMETREFTYQPPGEEHPITQYNRNHLLWEDERVTGLKTGHTGPAGFHLVATAEDEGMSLVAVVMGAPGQNEAEGFANREEAAKALLNYGFGQFRTKELEWTQVADDTLRVWKGNKDSVSVATAEPAVVTYVTGRESSLEVVPELSGSVDAPVAKGDKLGTLSVTQDGQLLRQFDLVATAGVGRGGFFKVFWDTLRKFFGGLFGGGS